MISEARTPKLLSDPASGLHCLRLASTERPNARVLLLHGVGGNETNLLPLAQHLPPDWELLLPRAPLTLAKASHAWFEVRFAPQGPQLNATQAVTSRDMLIRLLSKLPILPTAIAGFSQGGIMSAAVGLTQPKLVNGFGILSGRIPPELMEGIARPDQLTSLSAFIAHGRADSTLPLDWAHRAEVQLRDLGVAFESHVYDMGHEIIEREIVDFVQWLNRVLR